MGYAGAGEASGRCGETARASSATRGDPEGTGARESKSEIGEVARFAMGLVELMDQVAN